MRNRFKLDVHAIQGINLGIFRDAFHQVFFLEGQTLTPVKGEPFIWNFKKSGERGRILDVEGYLRNKQLPLALGRMGYSITRQGFTLVLLFSEAMETLNLNTHTYKVLEIPEEKIWPNAWPSEMLVQVIRHRFKKVAVADETALLKIIGLRKTLNQ